MATDLTIARITQAGAIPIDTLAVISELQQTWKSARCAGLRQHLCRPYMMPNYRLLMESYDKAQSVVRKGRETVLDAVKTP